MTKSINQINKEATVGDNDSSPAVQVYRMGQLELAVKEGFAAHDRKLDLLTSTFATKEDTVILQRQLDNYKWFIRALTTAVLLALASGVAGLLMRK